MEADDWVPALDGAHLQEEAIRRPDLRAKESMRPHEWKYDITTGEFLDAREITAPIYSCKSQLDR
jgi:hypothetical protein